MNRALRRHSAEPKPPKRGAVRPLTRSSTRAASARPVRRGIRGLFWPQWMADIASELRKVAWPPRQEIIYLTMVVIVVSAFLGAVLGGIDLGFDRLLGRILF